MNWTWKEYNDYLIKTGKEPIMPEEKSKFGNQKITINGTESDSIREYSRLEELKLLQRAGAIRNLKTQVSFVLIPSQKGVHRNERPTKYIADFVYEQLQPTGDWQQVVEDSKGCRTKDYIIKRKLMLYIHGISIKET